jgi:hypothetical protein
VDTHRTNPTNFHPLVTYLLRPDLPIVEEMQQPVHEVLLHTSQAPRRHPRSDESPIFAIRTHTSLKRDTVHIRSNLLPYTCCT